MEVERDEQIRQLAYRIWQDEGHPHGYEVQHWLKAEEIWLEEHSAKSTPKQPKAPKREQPKAPKRTKRKKVTDVSREL